MKDLKKVRKLISTHYHEFITIVQCHETCEFHTNEAKYVFSAFLFDQSTGKDGNKFTMRG